MRDNSFVLRFTDATSIDEANKYAAELADELTRDVAGLEKAEPIRDRDESQDFGASLILILGTATATAVAKGIQSWLSRRNTSAELLKDGTVKLSNLNSKDIRDIAKAFAGR